MTFVSKFCSVAGHWILILVPHRFEEYPTRNDFGSGRIKWKERTAKLQSRILSREHRRFPRSRGAPPLMRELLRVTCVFPQPSFKHFSLKSPLATDFKRWKLLLSYQSIDGESIHVEVFGDLVKRKQLFWHIITASDFGNPFMFGYT
jgi:hypothetical protein